ncbi:MAG: hypothetical protein O7A09_04780 [Proteobacteria bacterium]|nr:hypothetical protein [Pseudomonadota bacterium]
MACHSRLHLRLVALALAVLFLAACKGSGGGDGDDDRIQIPLEVSLAADPISRDPNHSNPTPFEQVSLDALDDSLAALADAFPYADYDAAGDFLLDAVDVDPGPNGQVLTDFRDAGLLFGGGAAGHDVLVLDGKFLDILSEYATFLALRQTGQDLTDPEDALDTIVVSHNASPVTNPDGITWLVDDLDAPTLAISNDLFSALMGGVLYHEFGHVYLFHVLDSLRDNNMLMPGLDLQPTEAEDAADTVAGMLIAKAGLDLATLLEMFDILAYYSIQQVAPDTRIADILDPDFQNLSLDGEHSSVAERKQLASDGYDTFLDFAAGPAAAAAAFWLAPTGGLGGLSPGGPSGGAARGGFSGNGAPSSFSRGLGHGNLGLVSFSSSSQGLVFIGDDAAESEGAVEGVEQCQDGVDNDGDGTTDFPEDLGCADFTAPLESPACSDGRDNDGDGHADYPADPECAALHGGSESGSVHP